DSPPSRNGPQNIYSLYEQVSYNCFIAAGLYLLLGGFSFCQVRLNKRKEYMVR
ncbi:Ribonuclease kappa, partial [Lemmus lemmus]